MCTASTGRIQFLLVIFSEVLGSQHKPQRVPMLLSGKQSLPHGHTSARVGKLSHDQHSQLVVSCHPGTQHSWWGNTVSYKDGSRGGDSISGMGNGNKFGSSRDVLWLRAEGVSGLWDESGSPLLMEDHQ